MRSTIIAGLLVMLAAPTRAQQIQSVGTAASLDVATWNVEWFGSTANGPSNEENQYQHVLAVVSQARVDLWALQEVASTTTFERLLSDLGEPWAGELATVSGEQRIGYVYRSDVVRKRNAGHILENSSYEFAGRLPLRFEAEITLPDTTFVAVFVTVHMKAFGDATSYDRRVEASQRLKTQFDFLESRSNLVLLGDLNDELRSSISGGRPSPYANFVGDPGDYRFLTMPLDVANECTFCGGSSASTIDHILVSDEFFDAADAGATDRMDFLFDAIPGFLSNTSDHLPVFAALLPSSASAVEPPSDPGPPAVYPLPARDLITVSLGRTAALRTEVRLLDILGRRRMVAWIAAGSRSTTLDVRGLPAGLYVVVLPESSRLVPILR